jgi:hypothetical protein
LITRRNELFSLFFIFVRRMPKNTRRPPAVSAAARAPAPAGGRFSAQIQQFAHFPDETCPDFQKIAAQLCIEENSPFLYNKLYKEQRRFLQRGCYAPAAGSAFVVFYAGLRMGMGNGTVERTHRPRRAL